MSRTWNSVVVNMNNMLTIIYIWCSLQCLELICFYGKQNYSSKHSNSLSLILCTIIEYDAASHLNVSSPIPYRKIRSCVRNVSLGINFAYGGAGVLSPMCPKCLKVNAQVQQLQDLVNKGVVSSNLLKSSIATLVVGTEYFVFLATNPNSSVRMSLLFVKYGNIFKTNIMTIYVYANIFLTGECIHSKCDKSNRH